MKRLLLLLLLFCSWWPEGTFAAECSTTAQLDDVGVLQFDNRSKGCSVWSLTLFSRGFTGFQFTIETAPDAGGTPGAWSTVTNILTGPRGALPATEADGMSQAYSFLAYAPWVRVSLGSVVGAGIWRVQLKGDIEAARAKLPLQGPVGCDLWAQVAPVTSATYRLVTGVANKRTFICLVSLVNSSFGGTVQLVYGTGATCGTGTSLLLPTAQLSATGAWFLFGETLPVLTVPAGQDTCIVFAGGNGGGLVNYTIW